MSICYFDISDIIYKQSIVGICRVNVAEMISLVIGDLYSRPQDTGLYYSGTTFLLKICFQILVCYLLKVFDNFDNFIEPS